MDSTQQRRPTPAGAQAIEKDPASPEKQFLADLTRRRAGLAALVLLAAYLVPVVLSWGIAEASDASLLGDSTWLAPTLVLTLGLGLVVALTIRFGGWFQAVSFGEEYMLSFRPVAGFLLGWWRFVLQLGAALLVIMISSDAENEVTLAEVSNAQTAALPTYAERAPIPEDWELFSDSLHQSPYAERPNATHSRSYAVPTSYRLADVKEWLESPQWADGVEGEAPFGALHDIECDAEIDQCAARVTPSTGEPVEHFVDVDLDLDALSIKEDGKIVSAGRLDLEVEYEKADSQ